MNPFYHILSFTAETWLKTQLFARTAFLFIIGIVFCPILAPITKNILKKPFVAPLFNGFALYNKTNQMEEKAIVVPIEAPFKFLKRCF